LGNMKLIHHIANATFPSSRIKSKRKSLA